MPSAGTNDHIRFVNPLMGEQAEATTAPAEEKQGSNSAELVRMKSNDQAAMERHAAEKMHADLLRRLELLAPRKNKAWHKERTETIDDAKYIVDRQYRVLDYNKERTEIINDAKYIVDRQYRVLDYKLILRALQSNESVSLEEISQITLPISKIRVPQCMQILGEKQKLSQLKLESEMQDELKRTETGHGDQVRKAAIHIYVGALENLEETIAGTADRIVTNLHRLCEHQETELHADDEAQIRTDVLVLEAFHAKAAVERTDIKERHAKQASAVVKIQALFRLCIAQKILRSFVGEVASVHEYQEDRHFRHWGMRFKTTSCDANCGCSEKMGIKKDRDDPKLRLPERRSPHIINSGTGYYQYCEECTRKEFCGGYMPSNTINWIHEKQQRLKSAEADERCMQYYQDGPNGYKEHLGPVAMSWAFVFACDQTKLKEMRNIGGVDADVVAAAAADVAKLADGGASQSHGIQ